MRAYGKDFLSDAARSPTRRKPDRASHRGIGSFFRGEYAELWSTSTGRSLLHNQAATTIWPSVTA